MYINSPVGSSPTYFPDAEFILNLSFAFSCQIDTTGFFLDFNNPALPDKDLHPRHKLFKKKDLHTLNLGISCYFET